MQSLTLTTAALLAAALPAIAQEADPGEIDCRATPGGVECMVEGAGEAVLYCLAEDAEGEPLANSTVSAGTGVAVFNSILPEDVGLIATVTCREE